MRKKVLLALVATVALVGGTLAVGTPVQAASSDRTVAAPKCVSSAEFKAVKKGMSRAKVHEIFQNQKPTSTGAEEGYAECQGALPFPEHIVIYYKSGVVTRKAREALGGSRTTMCVSMPEFKAVKKGMTKAKVHSTFGGQKPANTTSAYEEYLPCKSIGGQSVYIAYKDGKVKSKAIVSVPVGRSTTSQE
jgi:hypothetical protein